MEGRKIDQMQAGVLLQFWRSSRSSIAAEYPISGAVTIAPADFPIRASRRSKCDEKRKAFHENAKLTRICKPFWLNYRFLHNQRVDAKT
ncbi:hypothetical protein, partial [Anaeromassilibacillus sp. SJQ-1]|uniref:hypothetical protein n=1 Tax=Anaeromassilibacillus sp. SJQ-1 TaxID=3375419 RepID=UPI003988E5A1